MFLGIYHHPPGPGVSDYVDAHEVKDTWTNEAIAFASSYVTRTALWLKLLL